MKCDVCGRRMRSGASYFECDGCGNTAKFVPLSESMATLRKEKEAERNQAILDQIVEPLESLPSTEPMKPKKPKAKSKAKPKSKKKSKKGAKK